MSDSDNNQEWAGEEKKILVILLVVIRNGEFLKATKIPLLVEEGVIKLVLFDNLTQLQQHVFIGVYQTMGISHSETSTPV